MSSFFVILIVLIALKFYDLCCKKPNEHCQKAMYGYIISKKDFKLFLQKF